MNLRNIAIVYRKELRDFLRDRRTVISMIVVPIFFMPALTILVGVLRTPDWQSFAANTVRDGSRFLATRQGREIHLLFSTLAGLRCQVPWLLDRNGTPGAKCSLSRQIVSVEEGPGEVRVLTCPDVQREAQ